MPSARTTPRKAVVTTRATTTAKMLKATRATRATVAHTSACRRRRATTADRHTTDRAAITTAIDADGTRRDLAGYGMCVSGDTSRPGYPSRTASGSTIGATAASW